MVTKRHARIAASRCVLACALAAATLGGTTPALASPKDTATSTVAPSPEITESTETPTAAADKAPIADARATDPQPEPDGGPLAVPPTARPAPDPKPQPTGDPTPSPTGEPSAPTAPQPAPTGDPTTPTTPQPAPTGDPTTPAPGPPDGTTPPVAPSDAPTTPSLPDLPEEPVEVGEPIDPEAPNPPVIPWERIVPVDELPPMVPSTDVPPGTPPYSEVDATREKAPTVTEDEAERPTPSPLPPLVLDEESVAHVAEPGSHDHVVIPCDTDAAGSDPTCTAAAQALRGSKTPIQRLSFAAPDAPQGTPADEGDAITYTLEATETIDAFELVAAAPDPASGLVAPDRVRVNVTGDTGKSHLFIVKVDQLQAADGSTFLPLRVPVDTAVLQSIGKPVSATIAGPDAVTRSAANARQDEPVSGPSGLDVARFATVGKTSLSSVPRPPDTPTPPIQLPRDEEQVLPVGPVAPTPRPGNVPAPEPRGVPGRTTLDVTPGQVTAAPRPDAEPAGSRASTGQVNSVPQAPTSPQDFAPRPQLSTPSPTTPGTAPTPQAAPAGGETPQPLDPQVVPTPQEQQRLDAVNFGPAALPPTMVSLLQTAGIALALIGSFALITAEERRRKR